MRRGPRSSTCGSSRPPQTLLDGDVIDESHLHGIIAQLQALGLTVVSVLPVP